MEPEFTLRFRLDQADAIGDVDDIIGRLGVAGCLDALVGIGAPGKMALDFSRSATSLEQAIRGAIADVKTAIPSAVVPDRACTGRRESRCNPHEEAGHH